MDLEQKSIKRIQAASEMSLYHYGKPLVCTYSGGKDSDVMLELFRRGGIPFEVHNSHTTADAPQTVRHIRDTFHKLEVDGIKCTIEMPTYKGERTSMWKLIPQKLIPPTRMARYCCTVLKETGCANRFIATGVRWAESTQRKDREEFEKLGATKATREKFTSVMLMNDNDSRRRMNEHCMQKKKMVVNPIIDWKDSDVWEYINSENISTCELYKYNVSTSYSVQTVNNRGTDKEWQNPIISDAEHGKQVAIWLADYFSSGIEYELDYRGEPAIDCGDTIGQENKYDPNLKAIVEESQITLNAGLLGGGLVTRRKNSVARTKN